VRGTSKAKGQGPKRPESSNSDAIGRKRKRTAGQKDDTPRAFKRLMAFSQGKKFRSGLDDGKRSNQSKKLENDVVMPEAGEKPELPTIRPGERLGDFASRVDAELPLAGLLKGAGKTGKDPLGIKVQRTRKEKKMHRLYDQWRAEEARIKEKREEAEDLAEEQALEDEELGVSWPSTRAGRSKGASKARGAANGTEDLWDELRRKRAESKIGLHDVAKAPPALHRGFLSNHKVVQGAKVEVEDVPKAAGSIRRREELAKIRGQVVASYRSLVDERQPVT
jgi:hypothetical protein